MDNQITTPGYLINPELIDIYLPFEGREVDIYFITKSKTGYGHWQLLAKLTIDGETLELTANTTDSRLIDEWLDNDGEYNHETLTDALKIILSQNEGTLLNFENRQNF